MRVFLAAFLICFSFFAKAQSTKIAIPLGGNAWASGGAVITDEGVTQWTAPQALTHIYFRASIAQSLKIGLRLRVPVGQSNIKVEDGKKVFTKNVSNTAFDTIAVGDIAVQPGYNKITLQGLSKTGSEYANVTDLILYNVTAGNILSYVKTGSSFHFGRRGPSVHLRYEVPAELKKEVKWFYNEIEVPQQMDIIGSYFMADGFNGGYFGMQVNSATERRVLFSVWSPFNTDDPKSIPDSLRIKLIAKGAGVHGGEFGSEGSGGQSYLQYPWQAGKTYAFLLGAAPDAAHNTTTYTAWFKDVAAGKWLLVASFSRPQTNAYLSSLYSFVENFEPDNGDKTRMARFKNQWIAGSNGQWHELTGATYTGDETAKKNYRKDYAGGVLNGTFYLMNGGFFNNLIPLNQAFTRPATATTSVIDFKRLPLN